MIGYCRLSVLSMAIACSFGISVRLAHASVESAILATSPLAYWPLQVANGSSLVNGYTSTDQNGAAVVSAGVGAPESNAMSLNGNNTTPQYVSTSLSGGIPGTGSMVAWVNLAALPSTSTATYYVAGESQNGNDFDLQFQSDNKIYFYTGAGESTSYAPTTGTLAGQWHMIAATYQGGGTGFRDIYWDGALVASFAGSVNSASKVNAFNIGYSTVFGGRDFNGLISDVAVWNSPLSALQVSNIYSAAGSIPEPTSLSLVAVGFIAFGFLRHSRTIRVRPLFRLRAPE